MKKIRSLLKLFVAISCFHESQAKAYLPGLQKMILSPLSTSPVTGFFNFEIFSDGLALNCTFETPLEASGSAPLGNSMDDIVEFKLSIGPMVYYIMAQKHLSKVDNLLFKEGKPHLLKLTLEEFWQSSKVEEEVFFHGEQKRQLKSLRVDQKTYLLPSGLNTAIYYVLNLDGKRNIFFHVFSTKGHHIIYGLEIGGYEL